MDHPVPPGPILPGRTGDFDREPVCRQEECEGPVTAGAGGDVDGALVGERLLLARQLTRDADAKAGQLLSGAGVLAAVAALVVAGGPGPGPVRSVGAVVTGAALVVALTVLLAVLVPRGGRPDWVLAGDPGAELARVAGIVAVKHRLLRVAVTALQVAVLANAGVAGAVLAGAR